MQTYSASDIQKHQTTKEQDMKGFRITAMPIAIVVLLMVGFTASLTSLAGDKEGSISREMDIVDTAVSAGQFNTLAAALDAAELIQTLKGDGPFTVFAPTDEAFAKLPEGTVASLLEPQNRDQLIAILTYHVVPGKVMAKDVVNLSEATTVNGADISIKVMDGKVRINDATVVAADVATSNGVIHIVDTVILPN
jgi:uncharacterized surface protein with fasciclin (FAS1) repeats